MLSPNAVTSVLRLSVWRFAFVNDCCFTTISSPGRNRGNSSFFRPNKPESLSGNPITWHKYFQTSWPLRFVLPRSWWGQARMHSRSYPSPGWEPGPCVPQPSSLCLERKDHWSWEKPHLHVVWTSDDYFSETHLLRVRSLPGNRSVIDWHPLPRGVCSRVRGRQWPQNHTSKFNITNCGVLCAGDLTLG